MTLQYVYLAGPIAGCTYAEATNWRKLLLDDLAPGIVGINPMRLKEWCERYTKIPRHYEESLEAREFSMTGSPQAIACRDYYDVGRCDMMIAVLPHASVGTLIEVGWAIAHRTPTVVVSNEPAIIEHPLIKGHVGWIVSNLDIAVDIVNGVLGAYIPPVEV